MLSATSVRFRLSAFTALLVVALVALGTLAVLNAQAVSDQLEQEAQTVAPARSTNATVSARLRAAERSFSTFVVMRAALGESASANGTQEQVLVPAREAFRLVTYDLDRLDQLTSQPPFTSSAQADVLAVQVGAQRASVTAWTTWASTALEQSLSATAEATGPAASEIQRGSRLYQLAARDNGRVQASLDGVYEDTRAQAVAELDRSRNVLIAATAAAVLLALLVAWRTTRSLVMPLQQLGEVVRAQRVGQRNAWAATDKGAREVRAVAQDVNALNREHLRLLDKQAESLALLRAGNDVVASLARIDSDEEALELAAEAVGRSLGVDVVRIAMIDRACLVPEGAAGAGTSAVWSRDRSQEMAIPSSWWPTSPQGLDQLLPAGDLVRTGAGQDAVIPVPSWVRQDPVVAGSTASLVLPVALADRVCGLLSLHTWTEDRTWDEPELAYLQRVCRELARRVARDAGTPVG